MMQPSDITSEIIAGFMREIIEQRQKDKNLEFLFRCEADIQHALGQELQKKLSEARVHYEYRILKEDCPERNACDLNCVYCGTKRCVIGSSPIDIVICYEESKKIAFELKYNFIDGKGRYRAGTDYKIYGDKESYFKYDKKKIESLLKYGNIEKGFCILLTNNSKIHTKIQDGWSDFFPFDWGGSREGLDKIPRFKVLIKSF